MLFSSGSHLSDSAPAEPFGRGAVTFTDLQYPILRAGGGVVSALTRVR